MILLSVLLSINIFMSIWLFTSICNIYVNKRNENITLLTLVTSLLWGLFFYSTNYLN